MNIEFVAYTVIQKINEITTICGKNTVKIEKF